MSYKENKYSMLLFIITAFFAILQALKIISVSLPIVFGFALILYSVPALYMAMEKSHRIQIIVSVFLFFIGIILLLIKWYDILNPLKIVFPSLVFITGIVFLLLYLDNTKEKVFLYAGSIVSFIGLLVILLNDRLPIIYFTDRITSFLYGYWHILFLVVGITLFLNRKKK